MKAESFTGKDTDDGKHGDKDGLESLIDIIAGPFIMDAANVVHDHII